MRHAAQFERAVRRGARGGRGSLVVHLVQVTDPGPQGPVVGLVVSKSVGGAVTRNLVKRRLRALVRDRLTTLPHEYQVVVRALPASATTPYTRLAADLDAALSAARRRVAVPA
jgi:ribonuclease P protein component